ncbi:hypothetical protein [Kaistia defluvii]|uniref:Uncharacterized protein n=1 Tax=Kaistia defluvii TaxID=410841 RepID=A0ABV2R6Z5_9HYPH
MPEAIKALLKPIATKIGMDLSNSKGDMKNKQQLGGDVIRTLNAKAVLVRPSPEVGTPGNA